MIGYWVVQCLLLVLVPYLTWRWVKRCQWIAILNRIPGPPAGWPFLGHLPLLTRPRQGMKVNAAIYATFMELIEQYGEKGLIHFTVGTDHILLVCGPNTAEEILSSNSILKKDPSYDHLKEWFSDGLLVSHGPKWRTNRKLITPAFHFQILHDFLPIMVEQSAVFISRTCNMIASSTTDGDDDEPGSVALDLSTYFTQLTLDVISETSMGYKMNAQQATDSAGQNEYLTSVKTLSEIFMKRCYGMFIQFRWIFQLSPLARQLDRTIKFLHQFSDKVVQNRLQLIQSSESLSPTVMDDGGSERVPDGGKRRHRLALLDLLLSYHLKDQKKFTLEDVRQETDGFIFAGHDTTSYSMLWAVFIIGHHPEIQAKIQEELDEIRAGRHGQDGHDRNLSVDDLSRMTYLEACIKESMRLFATAPMIGRQTTVDSEIGGFQVPAGTTLYIYLFAIHRDRRSFPDPLRYDPDRFIPGTASFEACQSRSPYSFVPFSAGPRGCIGSRFAMMEMKVILSEFFRHFSVTSLVPLDEVTFDPAIILRPANPLTVRVSKRRSADSQ